MCVELHGVYVYGGERCIAGYGWIVCRWVVHIGGWCVCVCVRGEVDGEGG